MGNDGETGSHEKGEGMASIATSTNLPALDAVSQDVLIEVVRALEEQQWMLRAQFVERA
jgi:hypothetical protein